jgi:hypothetical protein
VYNGIMLEKIDESIEVIARFNAQGLRPAVFRWNKKEYHIKKINLIHKKREGGDMIYYFSVSDEANFFRLAFFTRDLSWRLEEIWY